MESSFYVTRDRAAIARSSSRNERVESRVSGAKKTEISIEFEEVTVIRKREHPVVAWCTGCHQRVSMLVAGDAARAAAISARALYRLVET